MAQAKRTTRRSTLSNVIRRKAFIEAGVCDQVAMVADAMPKATRSEVIGKCVDLGINQFTARTQYQKWYSHHH